MDVQVAILDVEGQGDAFAGQGVVQRGVDVEIEDVAEFVGLGCAGGLDAGGPVARVVAAVAGFAE